MLKIRRALISVWDKKGIIELAKKLAGFNVEIISTGKTAALLRENKINVKEVSEVTSFPQILSGRVKTLHPKIFGGILANKKNPLHMEEMKKLSIDPIDMVVVNFYPFAQKTRENSPFDEMIEYIDIGGPSMLRAAAKNFRNVACVSDIKQYPFILEELEKNKGFISEEILRKLAQDVFSATKEYDNLVYNFLCGKDNFDLKLEKAYDLRYGENPHQKASLYNLAKIAQPSFRQIQGKELSFNNFLDLDTALMTVREFNEPAAVIIKHASICGAGVAKSLGKAYKKAYLTDPLSAFGGVIGLNRKVDKETAKNILNSDFKECVIAPSYSRQALKLFSGKKNMRIVEADLGKKPDGKDMKYTAFGYLLQDRDQIILDKNSLKAVTRRKPTAREMKDLIFAFKVAKFVKSNAIVVAKKLSILGIGGGQPSRVGSVQIALRQAGKTVRGAVLASDGFFPKEDSIRVAYQKGIKAIIQPGGSIKDNDVIKLCNKLKIAMVFTGIRHFRH